MKGSSYFLSAREPSINLYNTTKNLRNGRIYVLPNFSSCSPSCSPCVMRWTENSKLAYGVDMFVYNRELSTVCKNTLCTIMTKLDEVELPVNCIQFNLLGCEVDVILWLYTDKKWSSCLVVFQGQRQTKVIQPNLIYWYFGNAYRNSKHTLCISDI